MLDARDMKMASLSYIHVASQSYVQTGGSSRPTHALRSAVTVAIGAMSTMVHGDKDITYFAKEKTAATPREETCGPACCFPQWQASASLGSVMRVYGRSRCPRPLPGLETPVELRTQ